MVSVGLPLLQRCRIPCLLQINKKTAALEEIQRQFQELKEDFLYNEGVLQERDDEICALESQLHRTTESHASAREKLHESELACKAAQSQLLIARDRCAASACCCAQDVSFMAQASSDLHASHVRVVSQACRGTS
jgi:septal ring factor EnvC (AmiA/AmiB activator)